MYIVSTLKRSGPINVLLNIVKYLNRETFNPIILTLSPEPSDSLKDEFESIGVKVVQLNGSIKRGLLTTGFQVHTFINREKVDLIHSHGIRPDFFSIISRPGVPTVSTQHNFVYNDYPMRYGRFFGFIMAFFHTRIIKLIDFPIACSKSIEENYCKYTKNIRSIQNGVDQELYHPVSHEEKIRLRTKLMLPLNKKIIVSVGHLSKSKDPETIIKGYVKSELSNDSVLLFLGNGPELERCQTLSKENENIIFLGRVNNVHHYLKCADYFVSASLAEGLPNATLEALACGLPVILSDIKPHLEILDYKQIAGYVFLTKNPKSLSDVFNKLLFTNQKELSDAAELIIKNKLNARLMSQKYQNLYIKSYRGGEFFWRS
ncbi:glycosyltransferase [Bacillus sp. REN3]|uniref:glycosyltransferase n=1 Tax=Bacillus sp. REN3 TaxID=2802440 RepID=UPI001AED647E|nr:glycosyltransferase [Bacillus sp. REN3]